MKKKSAVSLFAVLLVGAPLLGGPVGACSDSTGSGGSGPTGGAGGDPGSAALVINEIQAHNPEWLEIANSGDQPLDIGGLGLCDEDANGDCEIASALRFPAGTTIPAKGYLVVLTDQLPADGVGPHTQCGLVGVDECFFATWQIAVVDGEVIRAIDADDVEISSLLYPPAATVDETTSWSRLPDMTGDGELGQATPGAENAAP